MFSTTKSRSIKNTGERSFTINNAYHVDGCPTKFSHADYTGRYTAFSAQRAAEKAVSRLCKVKKIYGQCTLYIEMRETTQGSEGKIYSYRAKRFKLTKPVDVKGIIHNYKTYAKPIERVPTEYCKGSHKSSGRMRSLKHLSSKSRKSRTSTRKSSKSKKSTRKSRKTH